MKEEQYLFERIIELINMKQLDISDYSIGRCNAELNALMYILDRFHGKHFGDYFDCLGIPWEEVV